MTRTALLGNLWRALLWRQPAAWMGPTTSARLSVPTAFSQRYARPPAAAASLATRSGWDCIRPGGWRTLLRITRLQQNYDVCAVASGTRLRGSGATRIKRAPPHFPSASVGSRHLQPANTQRLQPSSPPTINACQLTYRCLESRLLGKIPAARPKASRPGYCSSSAWGQRCRVFRSLVANRGRRPISASGARQPLEISKRTLASRQQSTEANKVSLKFRFESPDGP